jgi:hypothetical protein
MNTDDTQFDRLVDDELNERERRELLGQLDDEPGGWRRCALAFLEAQCWRQALGEMPNLRDSLSAPLQSAAKDAGENLARRVETPRRALWLARAKVLSAMAASFLVALWAGTLAQQAWVGQPRGLGVGGDPVLVADNAGGFQPLMTPVDSQTNLVRTPRGSGLRPNPWHVVTVSAPSDGQDPRSSIEVPAIERDNIDEQWQRSVPPAIPDNVLQALARTGHQIEQQREFLPVPLQDGRQLVVPVDRVKLNYVGNGPY